jgi:hypothetical protein
MRSYKNIFLLIVVLLLSINTYATKRYWVGTGANLNWNATANWSASSGGASGSSVPVSTDSVYFDGSGLGQCSINATVNIKRLDMSSGYTDTIKQNSQAITIGTGGILVNGGTFWGGTSTIIVSSKFYINGGYFLSTTNTLTINSGTIDLVSGTFNHNNGNVKVYNVLTATGNFNFYDFELHGLVSASCALTLNSPNVLTVLNTFKTTGVSIIAIIGTGRIDAKGDIRLENTNSVGSVLTNTIKICGTVNQTIYGAAVALRSRLCNLIVDKASDTLFFKDYITCSANFTYTQGVLDVSTYSNTLVVTSGNNGATNAFSGKFALKNLEVIGNYTGTTLNLGATDSVTVSGDLTTSGTVFSRINSGAVFAKGDLYIGNTSAAGGGSARIYISGTGRQVFTGSALNGQGPLCSMVIDKTSDTLILKNTINVAGNWQYTQGIIDATSFNSTVSFVGGTRTVSGNHTLNNLCFYGTVANSTTDIVAGDTITVLGEMTTEGANATVINSGAIALKGNLTINNTNIVNSNVSTGTILINGTTNQTINGAAAVSRGKLCNVIINKVSDTLILKNYVNVGKNWTYIQGALDATTYNSTVAFGTLGGYTRTISGKHSLNNITFVADGTSQTTIIADTLTALGTFKLVGNGVVALTSGVVNVKGDITTNDATISYGGAATILLTGLTDQTVNGSTIFQGGVLPSFKFNKSSGTVILKNYVSVLGSWALVQGTIDATTYGSSVIFIPTVSRSITGKQTLNNVLFRGATNTANNLGLTDTISVEGELKMDGAGTLSINTGVIKAKGAITITNTSTLLTSSTGTVVICGTGSQTFTGSGVINAGKICKIKIDKPSGTLSLSSIITGLGSWEYIQGTVNPGTSTFVPFSTFSLDGQGTSNTMDFNNVTFNTSTTTLAGNLSALGKITISTSTTLNGNSKQIYVGGTWDNIGTFTYANTNVIFNGSVRQYITRTSGSITFDTMTVNKTAGIVSLSKPLIVNKQLTLAKGAIGTTATNLLSMLDNATTSGGSDYSYVCGPFKKTGNDIFVFPLGDTTLVSGAYHPLSMTAPTVATDAYTAQYFPTNVLSVYPAYTVLQTDSLSSISTCEHWVLTRNTGSSTVVPYLGWNLNSCNVGCHKLRVTGWDGTKWKSLGYGGITTSGSMGTVKAASGFSAASLPLVIARPVNSSLHPTVTASANDTICSGSGTLLSASGAVTYSWAPSSGLSATTGSSVTASPTTTTTYTVTGTNSLGCTGTATVTLTVLTPPTVLVSPAASTIFTGGVVSLTASGAVTYSWLPITALSNTTGAITNAAPLTSTTYTVTGTAANGCTATAAAGIKVEGNCLTIVLVSGEVCIQSPVTVSVSVSGSETCTYPVTVDFGDSTTVTDTITLSNSLSAPHTYAAVGSYTISVTTYDWIGGILGRDTTNITIIECEAPCDDCIPSFAPIPAKKYMLSAWAMQAGVSDTVTNYTSPKITVSSTYGSYSVAFTPSGPIIDGWQKIDGEFTLPGLATDINVKLESVLSGDCYFDDIRVFPFDGSMKSYVYDPINMRLTAELDERNYATFYEYDEEGKLVRVKKETVRGIMTIKENRNNTSK